MAPAARATTPAPLASAPPPAIVPPATVAPRVAPLPAPASPAIVPPLASVAEEATAPPATVPAEEATATAALVLRSDLTRWASRFHEVWATSWARPTKLSGGSWAAVSNTLVASTSAGILTTTLRSSRALRPLFTRPRADLAVATRPRRLGSSGVPSTIPESISAMSFLVMASWWAARSAASLASRISAKDAKRVERSLHFRSNWSIFSLSLVGPRESTNLSSLSLSA
mmetsp:Transcript_67719/g.153238  ORF Transcript_67719/g.153238 Transcript_67719/m.153238 type:complete len:228 (-) Transcript_67719:1522-2205(-)